MLCGSTVPVLKLNALKLFSTSVVVSFFTSLASTLPPLPDRKFITTLSNRRKFHASDNIQVLELPVSAILDTSFSYTIDPPQHLYTIDPPQHLCILHEAT